MDFTYLKNFMDHLTAQHVPGNSIVVYHENKEVFRYSSGLNDVETNTPMTGDELLNIFFAKANDPFRNTDIGY